VIVADALAHVAASPVHAAGWWHALTAAHPGGLAVAGVALASFPKLALGLSGFETGVLVMPQVTGGPGTPGEQLAARIAGTRKLLTAAALVMAVLLPAAQFQPGGAASGRALACLAHAYLGGAFGTAYDVSTIAILWFAGASAMAGLLNLVPRYLPRYGMSPAWAQATRPLVLVFTAVAFGVTWIFDADVDTQVGAYATGVLVLITSAAAAVTLSAYRGRQRPAWAYAAITAVFAATTIANMAERPDGIKIAGCFIAAILATSVISRVSRAHELRATSVTTDPAAARFLAEARAGGAVHIIANEPDARDEEEYQRKWADTQAANRLPAGMTPLFLEVTVPDASEFASGLDIAGEERHGYRILTVASPAVPNAIAALCLHLRDRYGVLPHVYFEWAEGTPLAQYLRYLLLGSGQVAPVTREVLRRAEPDPARRPRVHVT
jgi:hypothetical protein